MLSSLAGSAGLLSGCGSESPSPPASTASTAPPQQAQKTSASLDLYFVGGTAFRRSGPSYVAVQLRGKGIVHNQHPMDHRSYLVAPFGTFGKEGRQFPSGYDMTKLHPQLTQSPESYEAVCLLGKDVTLTIHAGTGYAFMGPHNALGTLDEARANQIWPRAVSFLRDELG